MLGRYIKLYDRDIERITREAKREHTSNIFKNINVQNNSLVNYR